MSPSQAETLNKVAPHAVEGRARLAVRWARFAARSTVSGDFDFVKNALRAEALLVGMTARDLVARDASVSCNICGWSGRAFYPNTGPGYDERHTLCPGCRGLDRHRTLLALLMADTDFFAPGNRIVEVAPMRGFEALCRAQPALDYTSFDLTRHAMETGDITAMRYDDESVDWFVCFHVIEHIPDEAKALEEIRRVLRPGGRLVLQVPIDWGLASTYEYDAPDPRDVGHVRRYGRDFGDRIASHGFEVSRLDVDTSLTPDVITAHGLSSEPIYLGRRPA